MILPLKTTVTSSAAVKNNVATAPATRVRGTRVHARVTPRSGCSTGSGNFRLILFWFTDFVAFHRKQSN